MLDARFSEMDEVFMLMKTGEDGLTAFRGTEDLGLSPTTWGRLRFRIGDGALVVYSWGGLGIGGRSKVSVEGRGVVWASDGAYVVTLKREGG